MLMSHITTATCQSVALERLTLVVTSYIRHTLPLREHHSLLVKVTSLKA